MSVSNGQPNSAEVLNPAFMSRTTDTSTVGKVNLNNTSDVNSGAQIVNTQRAINETFDAVGMTGEADANRKVYASNQVITNGDDRKVAIGKLDAKFHTTSGHKHDGAPGSGAPVDAEDIANVPYKGYLVKATNLTTITGTSTVVTTEMTGKTPSTNTTTLGVVVNAPNNIVLLRKTEGAAPDDQFKDALGNIVYGRITEVATVWTLSYFVDLAGTETAYNFTSSSNITWYYQELYNPLSPLSPVYNEFLNVPSDNLTESIATATTTLQGKVQLQTAVSAEIAAASTAGTANGIVANADHTHKGVHSLGVDGDATKLYGDVDLKAGAGITITRMGQDIQIDSGGALGYQEFLGTGNGVITTFGTMDYTPSTSESVLVFLDNILVEKTDYTVVGTSIQFTTAPAAAQRVYVFYLSSGVVVPPPPPTGDWNVEFRTITAGEDSAEQLTLTATPNTGSEVLVDVIGGSAQEYNVDYTIAGAILNWSGYGLDGVLSAGDKLRISYFS